MSDDKTHLGVLRLQVAQREGVPCHRVYSQQTDVKKIHLLPTWFSSFFWLFFIEHLSVWFCCPVDFSVLSCYKAVELNSQLSSFLIL